MHREFVEVSGDIVSRTRVRVPGRVGARGCKGSRPLLKSGVVLITVPTLLCSVANLAAKLALGRDEEMLEPPLFRPEVLEKLPRA
jgi:hypothetical protein